MSTILDDKIFNFTGLLLGEYKRDAGSSEYKISLLVNLNTIDS